MKRTIDEHAARFDQKADEYDEQDRPIYEACARLVIELADPDESDVVLDLGTGTGAIALSLAERAGQVIGRDISEEMLAKARGKVQAERETVEFGQGRFRKPNYEGRVDIVTSNYALHHLDDPGKREAIARIAEYQPRRFVLGDLMHFVCSEPSNNGYDPAVDDPATVGMLVDALTTVGFVITAVEPVTDHAGVLVAEAPAKGWEQSNDGPE